MLSHFVETEVWPVLKQLQVISRVVSLGLVFRESGKSSFPNRSALRILDGENRAWVDQTASSNFQTGRV